MTPRAQMSFFSAPRGTAESGATTRSLQASSGEMAYVSTSKDFCVASASRRLGRSTQPWPMSQILSCVSVSSSSSSSSSSAWSPGEGGSSLRGFLLLRGASTPSSSASGACCWLSSFSWISAFCSFRISRSCSMTRFSCDSSSMSFFTLPSLSCRRRWSTSLSASRLTSSGSAGLSPTAAWARDFVRISRRKLSRLSSRSWSRSMMAPISASEVWTAASLPASCSRVASSSAACSSMSRCCSSISFRARSRRWASSSVRDSVSLRLLSRAQSDSCVCFRRCTSSASISF
mmetsp:Transcript_101128/g.286589  ORF Transcript_101128/g.286589 Transcript_101128/m.286589 type:complete len:289 (-) Transcript_101128:1213-2079(-)